MLVFPWPGGGVYYIYAFYRGLVMNFSRGLNKATTRQHKPGKRETSARVVFHPASGYLRLSKFAVSLNISLKIRSIYE